LPSDVKAEINGTDSSMKAGTAARAVSPIRLEQGRL